MTGAKGLSVVWGSGDRLRLGRGVRLRHDPGIGPGRYASALAAVRSSGTEGGFASFTFDPAEPGSVLVVPAEVEDVAHTTELPPGPAYALRTEDDGLVAWRRAMTHAVEAVGRGEVEKVVVARQVDLVADQALAPHDLALRLHRHGTSSYVFCVDGLVGASPELLVSLRDGLISSLVLAGTSPTPEGLDSETMHREHSLALESVRAGLGPHLDGRPTETTGTMGFGPIHHLGTRIEAPAAPSTDIGSILADLHPTAAVAGTPREAAMALIRAVEQRPRGRYAGPVGWMDRSGDGVFTLALRCGHIDGRRIRLYAGGGIVAGSDPAAEKDETEVKLQPMLEALGQGSET